MKKQTSFVTGIILIVIGAALILHRYDLFDSHYLKSFGFFAFGVLFLIQGVVRSSSIRVYFSTVITLIGLYYILDMLNILEAYRELNISVYTIIFGLAFYPLFFLNHRRWNYLLFGNLVTLVGLIFLLWHFEVIDSRYLIDIVDKYWPVVVILAGFILLYSAFQHREKKST